MRFKLVALGLLSLCLLAGCKKDAPTAKATVSEEETNVEKLVKKHIDDDLRKDQLLLLLDKSQSAMEHIKLEFLRLSDQIRTNPTMSREEADALLAEFRTFRQEKFQVVVGHRMQMRQIATAEEWALIYPIPEEASK